jgi:uncharacterized protein
MKCPACGRILMEMEVAGIKVDVCRGGCAGIWFDQYELKKFDEPHEAEGLALLDVDRDPSVNVDHSAKRECPRCDTPMMRHFYSFSHEIEIDECPRCAGFWLDQGELAAIRDQFDTEEGRESAADEAFSKLFGEELARMETESRSQCENTGRIGNILRFLCPSRIFSGR